MTNNFQPLDSDFAYDGGAGQGIRITEEMRGYWRETARWTAVLSTLAMIVVSILTIGFVVTLTTLKGNGSSMGAGFGVILAFAFMIAVAYKTRISLDQYARGIRKAADQNNQKSLENAYANLLWFFKIMAVVYLISLAVLLFSCYNSFVSRGEI